MSARGKPRPKAYLSIGEYLRKAGAFKTVNIYYNDIISTHPSVALSENGDDEEVDELTHGLISAAKHGHLEKLRFLAGEAQKGRKVGGVGTCIGERVTSLMLHLAAENGHEAIVHYLVQDLWVDIDAATVRGMTALHYAAKANRTAVVRELARLGADLEARNDSGLVPAQLTKDRLLRRLFQQYLGGSSLTGAPMVDRFVVPPTASSRIVDYVVVMTVKLAPQLEVDSDKLSDVRQATVSEIWRYPEEDHEDTPMPSPSNLAEMCTQNCHEEGGPLAAYGTLLTDMSGRRSHVFSKVLGVYQDAAQKGRAKVHAALGPPEPSGGSCAAGELTARMVLVLSRYPYTSAFAVACDHVAELILEEAPKWGSLGEWSLAMEHERNAQIKFAIEFYATELRLPLPSRIAEVEVLGRTLAYGDPHASHSGLPHLEEADLRGLFSRLGSDKVLTALSCLLQEQSVLILSNKLEDLGPASAALLGLLFPMQWPHTVIPVLPVSLLHYLEAPVPFVMGMDASALGRVTADLSCITIVNLVSGKVVLPIRPITSVSSEPPSAVEGDTGSGAHRRPSRRDSTTRALAELPIGLRRQTERRLRRCVPLEMAPASDRSKSQPRASKFYTPGLRVATVDLMVALVGSYQTYRYAPGAGKRVISEAPEDHRRILEAILTSQLWCSFRDDLLSEEGEGGGDWEAQAQLFCACVERAQHSDKGGASNARVESNSCKDVLYPSEDVEEQLALLSVYPALDAAVEGPPSPQGSDAAAQEDGIIAEDSKVVGGTSAGSALSGDLDLLQGKTDGVIRSITSSFVAVTDMFGATDDSGSGIAPVRQAEVSPTTERRQERSQSEVGWDLFKRQSMSQVKRRLEGMRLGDPASSRTPEKSGIERADGRTKGGFGARISSSLSPARRVDEGSEAGGGGALGAFGESLKEWRRRSTEAMTGAVSKLKNALDDTEEDGSEMRWGGKGTKSRASESDWRVRAAAANGRRPPEAGGDPFWNPFGEKRDAEDRKDGGNVSHEYDDDDEDDEDDEDEPVPLPEPGEARGKRSDSPQPASVRNRLHTFYGAGAR